MDAIFIGRDSRYNRRLGQMYGHYLVEREACTPASAWEKGQVENQVGLWQMVSILTCVLSDGLNAVEVACQEALDHGVS